MEKMIMMTCIDDVKANFEEINLKQTKNYNKDLHLSKVAICGYKYRYELDHNITYPFNWRYIIGESFEKTYLELLGNPENYEFQKKVVLYSHKYKFVGHIDAFDKINNTILELKFSYSNELKDIYVRQIIAYMIALNVYKGKVIVYGYKQNEVKEYDIEFNGERAENLLKNLSAFTENRYISGIENYLCNYCVNVDCPMNKKVKK